MQTLLSYHNRAELALSLGVRVTATVLSARVELTVTQQAHRLAQLVQLAPMPHTLAPVIA